MVVTRIVRSYILLELLEPRDPHLPEIHAYQKTFALTLHNHLSHKKDALRATFELALVNAEKEVDWRKTW